MSDPLSLTLLAAVTEAVFGYLLAQGGLAARVRSLWPPEHWLRSRR